MLHFPNLWFAGCTLNWFAYLTSASAVKTSLVRPSRRMKGSWSCSPFSRLMLTVSSLCRALILFMSACDRWLMYGSVMTFSHCSATIKSRTLCLAWFKACSGETVVMELQTSPATHRIIVSSPNVRDDQRVFLRFTNWFLKQLFKTSGRKKSRVYPVVVSTQLKHCGLKLLLLKNQGMRNWLLLPKSQKRSDLVWNGIIICCVTNPFSFITVSHSPK